MLENSRVSGLTEAGVILLTFLLAVLVPVSAIAQSADASGKIIIKASNKPLNSLRGAAESARHRPVVAGTPRQIVNFSGQGRSTVGQDRLAPDALLQQEAGQQLTAIGSGFPGASNDDNYDVLGYRIAPPDTDGQVGPNHFVQMINSITTIFDKNGTIVDGPFASNVLWAGIGGNCEPHNQGDPIVLYDDQEDKWLVSQFAFPDNTSTFSQCVAISATGDPMGTYHRYEFSFDGIGLNDYPKHGIVSDSITMIANIFTKRGRRFSWGGTFLGVMDKNAMYSGNNASLVGFNIGKGEFGFVAGDLDGASTEGVPALFATAMSNSAQFDIWEIDVDWSTGNATRSRIAIIPIAVFDSTLCGASRGACIPQPDGGPSLESLSDRLMHRLQIRDFGTHRSMMASHTVDVGGGRAGIRWYEMRETSGTWGPYQEGTFAPNDGLYRWMPSAAMNSTGDIGIGYMLASSDVYVSTAAAGQTASASGTGNLDSTELICAAGTGVQTGVARSGDYSSTSVDPLDDTFWHTNEVFTKSGEFEWDTFVCEFEVASGGNNPPSASIGYACIELGCNFTDNSSDPGGSIASWAWNFGDGATSTAQNPAHTFPSSGTYTVDLTVTDNEGAVGSTSLNVTVSDQPNVGPTASFTTSCTDLTCSFTDTSTDGDGSVDSWSWTFGDGATSTAQNPSHTYASENTYTVGLTVTDNDNASDSASGSASPTTPTGVSLSGSAANNGKTWTATVTDANGSDLQGSWSTSTGSASCTGSGQCSLSGIPKKTGSVTFTAASGPQITVLKP